MAKSQTCFSKDADMTNWLDNKVSSWCYDLKNEKDASRQTRKYFTYIEILMAFYELELITDFEYRKYSNQLCDATTEMSFLMWQWRNR